MATEKEQPKNPFKAPEGKAAVILFPHDSNDRSVIEDKLREASIELKAKLVYELKVAKLNPNHVVFTVVAKPTRLNDRKQPVDHTLVISPPLECSKFLLTGGDDDFGDVNVPLFVDEIQKHVRPFCVKLSEDKILKVMRA